MTYPPGVRTSSH